jgi:hypothetical protein
MITPVVTELKRVSPHGAHHVSPSLAARRSMAAIGRPATAAGRGATGSRRIPAAA